MRLLPLVLAPALLAATPVLAGARGESPVVVELYTSQGCSGCLEASAFAGELAEREDVLLLSFGVDYWDYMGWRDTFAKPEFVERQRAYIGSLRDNPNRHPYTPQMIVDGHFNGEGISRDLVELAIDMCLELRHLANSPPIDISRDGDELAVEIGDGAQLDAPGDVWLVAFEPGVQQVAIGAGENADQVMNAYNVVRSITRLGAWSGDPVRLVAPAAEDLTYAVLVQGPALGAMIGTAAENTPTG
jgi:hypothetical protein